MGLSLEAMDSLEKLITVSETYWHAHPDDERAFEALSTAYNNAAIIDDPRLNGAEALDERAFALLRKRMWADEKLLALKPNEFEYQVRLAGTRYNIGLHLAYRRKFEEALVWYEQAWPVGVKEAALDRDNIRAQYTLALYQTRLAHALFKTGSIEKARLLFLDCDRILVEVFKQDNSLRTAICARGECGAPGRAVRASRGGFRAGRGRSSSSGARHAIPCSAASLRYRT